VQCTGVLLQLGPSTPVQLEVLEGLYVAWGAVELEASTGLDVGEGVHGNWGLGILPLAQVRRHAIRAHPDTILEPDGLFHVTRDKERHILDEPVHIGLRDGIALRGVVECVEVDG